MNNELAEHMGAYGGKSDMSGKGNGCGQGMDCYGAGVRTGYGFAEPVGHATGRGRGIGHHANGKGIGTGNIGVTDGSGPSPTYK